MDKFVLFIYWFLGFAMGYITRVLIFWLAFGTKSEKKY